LPAGSDIRSCGAAASLCTVAAMKSLFRVAAELDALLAGLDWRYILEQLRPLCQINEAPEIIERLRHLRNR